MQKSVKDIGSMFHQTKSDDEEIQHLEKVEPFLNEGSYAFFYTGRHAIFAILNDILTQRKIRKIWMPRYFCHNVINAVTSLFKNVDFYDINPFYEDITFNYKTFATAEDVILLNNFWGLKSYEIDTEETNRPTYIEDHSHGWRTEQCLKSRADYALCSLRKTYPVSLGAIAWKPNGEMFSPLYQKDNLGTIDIAYNKLNLAFSFKREYLSSGNKSLQSKFLLLLDAGERLVSASRLIEKPSSELFRELSKFINRDPNRIKLKNLQYLHKTLESSDHYRIISHSQYTAFGLLLLFKDASKFLDFKSYLIEKNIYPANLWPNNTLTTEWHYFYNIHVDFRYSLNDMEYLATKINSWSPTY